MLADRIALLAVYMPLLRFDVKTFVYNWNRHYIRRQLGRLNVVTGRLHYLYNYNKDAYYCGFPID